MDIDFLGFNIQTPATPNKTTTTAVIEFIIHLILAVSFFAICMCLYFFFLASKIEAAAVTKNTVRVVDQIVAPIAKIISSDQRRAIDALLCANLNPPDMHEVDDMTAQSNANLISNVLLVMGSSFGVGVLFCVALWAVSRHMALCKTPGAIAGAQYPNLLHIVLEVLALTLFVFIAEVLFLLVVGLHWQSVDIYHLELTTIDTILAFLASTGSTE